MLLPGQMTIYVSTFFYQCKHSHSDTNIASGSSQQKHSLLWLHAIEAGVFISSSSSATIDRPTATAVNLVPQDMLVVRTRKYPLTIRVRTHGCFRSITLHKHVIRVHAITPMGTCKPIVQTIAVQSPCICMMCVAIVHLWGS